LPARREVFDLDGFDDVPTDAQDVCWTSQLLGSSAGGEVSVATAVRDVRETATAGPSTTIGLRSAGAPEDEVAGAVERDCTALRESYARGSVDDEAGLAVDGVVADPRAAGAIGPSEPLVKATSTNARVLHGRGSTRSARVAPL
jgi:hypothetical protein